MRLAKNLALQYGKELESIERELNIPYITDTERPAEREGLRKGRTEGRREGELQGLREAVTDAPELPFSHVPYTVREAVSHIDSEKRLRELLRMAITVSSVEEFRV